ncbi:hypothetical protein FHJ31_14180 [Pseudomonas sp. Fig-3]|uniref:AAA family ATPase n=1 Tax=unclassified Pseudomonas TaxID=196821 RepID=UPI0011124A13|nr:MULTISPECIES: AAA family ATPase [unclassified Pseudomonas]TNB84339.1 hypothetical protein FHJ31_14180 [Pseudomonas sp. Fig-3]
MIRTSRAKKPPAFLRSQQVHEQRLQILNYLRRGESERRERRDGLNEDLFFDSELRFELENTFKGKCAFCETGLGARGLTLHLRPLRFVQGGEQHELDYYLWLAFEWRNLFYACDYCAKAKGNHFPVEGNRGDFRATFDEVVKQESALLIDPTAEDPGKHLSFLINGSVTALSPKGFETISIFSLNRPELKSERNKIIDEMIAILESRASAYRQLDIWVNSSRPHFGAALQVLKRIAKSWFPNRSSIKGSGDTFVSNFTERLNLADNDDLGRLQAAIQTERRAEQADSSSNDDLIMFRRTALSSPIRPIARELATISLSHFKAIDDLHLEFASTRASKAGMPAMMILGENSTGKSSILAAIALALIGRREAEKLKKILPGLVQSPDTDSFDQLDEHEVVVEINFFFEKKPATFKYDPTSRAVSGTEDPAMIVLGYGARRFFDQRVKEHAAGAAARVKTLFDPLATIPFPGDWLRAQTGRRFDTVSAALRVVLALNDDDELIVEPDRLAVRANGRVTPIDALSEGYRSVFVMTVDIIRELLNHWEHLEEAQAVVLIDELETHLHPRWKMQVMTSLRKVLPRVQFIVTTHDPLCIRGMDDGEVVVLQRDQQNQIRALEDLPQVSGMTAEQLLTSDYFGLASTSDPSTEIALATIAGDVARRSRDEGKVEIALAASTTELVGRLTIGDTPTQQVIQNALTMYLEQRESRNGQPRPKLRAEAVEAVLKALSGEGN